MREKCRGESSRVLVPIRPWFHRFAVHRLEEGLAFVAVPAVRFRSIILKTAKLQEDFRFGLEVPEGFEYKRGRGLASRRALRRSATRTHRRPSAPFPDMSFFFVITFAFVAVQSDADLDVMPFPRALVHERLDLYGRGAR